MKGFEQQRAHELAIAAAEWAKKLNKGEYVRMETETSMDGTQVKVTFWFTKGSLVAYSSTEEMEGDTPAGESLPF